MEGQGMMQKHEAILKWPFPSVTVNFVIGGNGRKTRRCSLSPADLVHSVLGEVESAEIRARTARLIGSSGTSTPILGLALHPTAAKSY